jgi:hypothetical protein
MLARLGKRIANSCDRSSWILQIGLTRQSGRQDDLTGDVLCGLGHEGLACIHERVDRADLGSQPALIYEAGHVPELCTARVAYEVNGADVVSIGFEGEP